MTTRPSSSSTSSEQPLPKRQALTSQKVCIICNCDSLTSDELYNIYIVDVNESSKKSRSSEEEVTVVSKNPAIRMDSDYPFKMAFAVSKSILYMFGGEGEDSWETSSYRYDLSSEISDLKLTKEMLVPIASMRHKKFLPKAVLISNGKICVFSSILADPEKSRVGFKVSDSNFELYDPDNNTWSLIPEPFTKYLTDEICQVICFAVENSTLFISTERGFYGIDLKEEKLEWKEQKLEIPNKKFPFNGLGLKVGGVLFGPSYAYYLSIPWFLKSLDSDCVLRQYEAQPIPFLQTANFIRRDSGITLCPSLINNEDKLRVCIVQAGFEYFDHFIPSLLVDYLNCDLGRAQYLLDNDPQFHKNFSTAITNLSACKFCLDGNLCDKIEILGVFPF